MTESQRQRRCVVTGSSGGIGSACVDAFAKAGWHVIGLDRVEPVGTALGEHIRCDMSQTAEVLSACAAIRDGGPIDALVNNAAVQVNKGIADTTDEEWALVMATNVRASFECMRELLPAMSPVRGAVVNIASVHAVATSTNISAYAASKGALVALTRAAAVELAENGIRCNAVLPGAVDTSMLRDGLSRRPHPLGAEGNLEELRSRTPLGLVALPSDIAEAVLFLADPDRSRFITGQTLVADGGATSRLSTE